LLPFCAMGSTIGAVRGPDGCGYYSQGGPGEPTPSLVYVFKDGEVWAINTLFLSVLPDLILLEEARFTESLERCSDFLASIGIAGPYRWVAGMEGVQDRHLREDALGRKIGPCLVDVIESEGVFKSGDDARQTLEPFFEKFFEECGLERPSRLPAR
jgi:hypothetical protein